MKTTRLDPRQIAAELAEDFTQLYYYCHLPYTEEIGHRALRALQYIAMNEQATVQDIATYLGVAHNTASELIRRLVERGVVRKQRSTADERVVHVVVTDDGRQVLRDQTGLDRDKLSQCLSEMPPQDVELIHQAFQTLRQRLQAMVPAETSSSRRGKSPAESSGDTMSSPSPLR
jgi:MarR family transcriptional regulator, organic hydroperoxide resistance regulator